MGSCLGKKKNKFSKEDLESFISKAWMKESGCIDKFSFDKNLDKICYDEMQVQFADNCLKIDQFQDFGNESPCFSKAFVSQFKEIIIK